MTQYSEHELVLPALALLDRYEAGLTTSDLIRELTTILKPDGSDADILAGRNDTYFSQKVRNLVSHRTLAEPGFETYDATRQHHSITPAGRRYLAEARERGELAQGLIPGPTLSPQAVFPDYQSANETPATRVREPFSVDPNEVDRSLGAHAATQNALAAWVVASGRKPLRPAGGVADFDLAWEVGSTFWVAEVKSLTRGNETINCDLGWVRFCTTRRCSARTDEPFARSSLSKEPQPTIDGSHFAQLTALRWCGRATSTDSGH